MLRRGKTTGTDAGLGDKVKDKITGFEGVVTGRVVYGKKVSHEVIWQPEAAVDEEVA